jgi:hypothetical protein
VHVPEFAFEKKIDNVKRAVGDLASAIPGPSTNDRAVRRAFNNRYWPAHYFVDAAGRARHHHFGEGSYDESDRVIQQLLAEAGNTSVSTALVDVKAAGVTARSATARSKSSSSHRVSRPTPSPSVDIGADP